MYEYSVWGLAYLQLYVLIESAGVAYLQLYVLTESVGVAYLQLYVLTESAGWHTCSCMY